jgi:hypothetical protein
MTFDGLRHEERTDQVLSEVKVERARQDRKWGVQHHDPFHWLSVETEELGEAAKEANEWWHQHPEHLAAYRKEMLEVAAVAVAAIEDLDRHNGTVTEAQENTVKDDGPASVADALRVWAVEHAEPKLRELVLAAAGVIGEQEQTIAGLHEDRQHLETALSLAWQETLELSGLLDLGDELVALLVACLEEQTGASICNEAQLAERLRTRSRPTNGKSERTRPTAR